MQRGFFALIILIVNIILLIEQGDEMKEFLRVSLKKYCPAKDVETYLSLIFATAITFIAVKSSAYSLVLEMMPDIKPFIIGVIGGSIALLGISVSGIAIVIAMFTVEDIEHINTIKPGAFKELLWDFKFFAFHIAGES